MIKSGASIETFSLTTSFFWENEITGFRVGTSNTLADGKTASGFYVDATEAIYDTGTTLLYAPDGNQLHLLTI